MARRLRNRHGPGVRWGHVHELDRRTRIGTPAWEAAHSETRLKKLSAWRGLHAIAGNHKPIRRAARSLGVKPSSNMRLQSMLKLARRLQQ